MAMFGFPHWQLKSTSTESGVVAPDERLPFAQTAVMGVQHAVAMFGATVLMPILMGLDPNLSILMSGIGTLLFFFITGGRVPVISFQRGFCRVVIAATGFNGQGINPNSQHRAGRDYRLWAGLYRHWLVVMKSVRAGLND